jgi:hypothetical protein
MERLCNYHRGRDHRMLVWEDLWPSVDKSGVQPWTGIRAGLGSIRPGVLPLKESKWSISLNRPSTDVTRDPISNAGSSSKQVRLMTRRVRIPKTKANRGRSQGAKILDRQLGHCTLVLKPVSETDLKLISINTGDWFHVEESHPSMPDYSAAAFVERYR